MKKIQQAIYILGGILLVVGAALYITGWAWVPYMYIAGSFMFGAMQMLDRYTGKNLVLRRLRRQQLLGAIALTQPYQFRVWLSKGRMLTIEKSKKLACHYTVPSF